MGEAQAPEWYTRTDAARRLRCSQATIRHMIENGDLRVVRFGRRTVIPASEIARFEQDMAGRAS